MYIWYFPFVEQPQKKSQFQTRACENEELYSAVSQTVSILHTSHLLTTNKITFFKPYIFMMIFFMSAWHSLMNVEKTAVI